jgi:hypothetical protein
VHALIVTVSHDTSATLLLSEVIARLPALKLDEGSLHFLSAFYADRLQVRPTSFLSLLLGHAVRS